MRCSSNKGLTLIELLVVIAVMAVLAGILTPILVIARSHAQRVECQSNLLQIGSAFEMYLNDYDGHYPNNDDPFLWMGRKWRWLLLPYLSSDAEPDPTNPMGSKRNNARILLCPADSKAVQLWDSTSYAYSMCFYHTPDQINGLTKIEQTWSLKVPCVSIRKRDIRYPSKKALVAEWLSNHETPHVGWNSWKGGRNYLFADGHCAYLRATEINKANDGWPDINLTRDGFLGKDIE